MTETASPGVTLIAWTHFQPPADVSMITTGDAPPWSTDADGGQALAEFAGRACYQAWDKPNPATATNAGYLRHILEVGHLAVLEHASATFLVSGVSRALTHELVRHRHLSFSELSPRYAPQPPVEPEAIAADPELHALFEKATTAAGAAYDDLLAALTRRYAGDGEAAIRRKQVRQAARTVLPLATASRIVVTGNYRAWRHFIAVRASEQADVEIRTLAIACLAGLRR
ncbi:MAG TPA: FAD-dependent thymidylate synthase, partial [Micromonosporaceae bacterium]|nr:FAD-dependent thymidylate synthase [Micromonosporaceae bacterium]